MEGHSVSALLTAGQDPPPFLLHTNSVLKDVHV